MNDAVEAEQLEARARDPRRAPCDPGIKISFLFTDVEAAAQLWTLMDERLQQQLELRLQKQHGVAAKAETGTVSSSSKSNNYVEMCMVSHAAMVRRVLIAYQAHEVRLVGDGFFIAIVNPVLAVRMAVEIMARNDELSAPSSDAAECMRELYAAIAPPSDAAVEEPFREMQRDERQRRSSISGGIEAHLWRRQNSTAATAQIVGTAAAAGNDGSFSTPAAASAQSNAMSQKRARREKKKKANSMRLDSQPASSSSAVSASGGGVQRVNVQGHQLSQFSCMVTNSNSSSKIASGAAASALSGEKYKKSAAMGDKSSSDDDGEAAAPASTNTVHNHFTAQQREREHHFNSAISVLPLFEHTSFLRMRIGINNGHCIVVHQHHSNEFDYSGDTVEIAARVCSLAHGHQILVTDEVVDAARFLYGGAALMERVQFRFIDEVDAGGPTAMHDHSDDDDEVDDGEIDNSNSQSFRDSGAANSSGNDVNNGGGVLVFQVDVKSDSDDGKKNRRETMITFPPLRVARAREATAVQLLHGESGAVAAGVASAARSSAGTKSEASAAAAAPPTAHIAIEDVVGVKRKENSPEVSITQQQQQNLHDFRNAGASASSFNMDSSLPGLTSEQTLCLAGTHNLCSSQSFSPLVSAGNGGNNASSGAFNLFRSGHYSSSFYNTANSTSNGSGGGPGSAPTASSSSVRFDVAEFSARFLHTVLAAVPRDMRSKALTAFLLSWGVHMVTTAPHPSSMSAEVMSPQKKQKMMSEASIKALREIAAKALHVMKGQQQRRLDKSDSVSRSESPHASALQLAPSADASSSAQLRNSGETAAGTGALQLCDA